MDSLGCVRNVTSSVGLWILNLCLYKSADGGLSPEAVTSYLQSHPKFLERYVIENIKLNTIESWAHTKNKQANHVFSYGKSSPSLELGMSYTK